MSQIGNYTSIWALYKEIKNLKRNLLFFTITLFMCYFWLCFVEFNQNERLNEHKKVIELINCNNNNLKRDINVLMKNQILINNKLKRYERNK